MLEFSGWAVLETVVGDRNSALRKCNETLEQDWLSQPDVISLTWFRNEIEHYQGGGVLSFSSKASSNHVFCLPTSEVEHLEKVGHVNFLSKVVYGDFTQVSVTPKFISKLERNYPENCN